MPAAVQQVLYAVITAVGARTLLSSGLVNKCEIQPGSYMQLFCSVGTWEKLATCRPHLSMEACQTED